MSYASPSSTCQAVQIAYPKIANAGQKIVITTTVTSACILLSTVDYNQVIVNILLPNTAITLSTASATVHPAVNTVTAPATGGPWNLVVQVLWTDYPMAGTLASSQTTITIQINGPLRTSTVTSHTVSSTKFTSSGPPTSTVFSTVTSVEVGSSTVIPNSTVTSLMNLTTTSLPPTTSYTTLSTSSSLPSDLSSTIIRYLWQNSIVALILGVVVVLLLVGILVLKRRRR